MKLLNFGSMNLDIVYRVEHLVRPGETISSKSRELFCGGKGLNQSVALARAGAPVFHAGRLGIDGGRLRDLLRQNKVDLCYLRESALPSGQAVIQVDDSGQNCIILYAGANHDIDKPFIDEVLRDFSAGDILLLQNEISNLPYLMERAGEMDLLVAFNPSPMNPEVVEYPLDRVHWFILNEIEGEALTGRQEPHDIAEALLKRYPSCAVVLTLGKLGVYYRDSARSLSHGIYRVPLVDTTGAGDTFTGYFLASTALGLPVEEILRRASVASALAVSRPGAAASIPTLSEVLAARLEPERG